MIDPDFFLAGWAVAALLMLLAWGSPEWWLTLLGPALMLYALLEVTGIPYTE